MSVEIRTMIFFTCFLWFGGYVLNISTQTICKKRVNTIVAYLCGIPYKRKIGMKSLILQMGGILSITIGGVINIAKPEISLFIYLIMFFITFFSAGIYTMIKEGN